MTIEQPAGWGDDKLTDFISKSQYNIYASFSNPNAKPVYDFLSNINETFHVMTECLQYPSEGSKLLPSMLFLRSHSCFLGSLRLSLSGQLPESYIVMRGCLENALYGLHMETSQDDTMIWLNRHDNDESMKAAKARFTIRNVFKTLGAKDSTLKDDVNKLYNTTIDYGAHPNERAIFSMMKHEKVDDSKEKLMQGYLECDSLAHYLSLKTNSAIGIAALLIIEYVYPERFEIMGISDKLHRYKVGIEPLFGAIRKRFE